MCGCGHSLVSLELYYCCYSSGQGLPSVSLLKMAVIPIHHGGKPAASGAAVRERALHASDMLALSLGRWPFQAKCLSWDSIWAIPFFLTWEVISLYFMLCPWPACPLPYVCPGPWTSQVKGYYIGHRQSSAMKGFILDFKISFLPTL